MNGKGLTPNQLQVVFVDVNGKKVGAYGPYTGMVDAVASINVNSAYEPEISYYKAYRAVRQYGVYTEQIVSKEADNDGTRNVLVVIISAAPGHEVKPGFALAQEPAVPQPAPLFEVGQGADDMASLADLARDINKATKRIAPVKIRQAKAAKPVVPLKKYRIEFYFFTAENKRYELTSQAVVRASSKKIARDVLRELAKGQRVQIMWIEEAPKQARVTLGFAL